MHVTQIFSFCQKLVKELVLNFVCRTDTVLHLTLCPLCSMVALGSCCRADPYFNSSLLTSRVPYKCDKIVIMWLIWELLCFGIFYNSGIKTKLTYQDLIDFPAEPHHFKCGMHGMNSPSSCRLLRSDKTCQSLEGEIHILVLDQQLLPLLFMQKHIYIYINFFFFTSIQTCYTFFPLCLCFHWSTKQLIQNLLSLF